MLQYKIISISYINYVLWFSNIMFEHLLSYLIILHKPISSKSTAIALNTFERDIN